MGWGAIDLAVKPGKAEVWLDGNAVEQTLGLQAAGLLDHSTEGTDT